MDRGGTRVTASAEAEKLLAMGEPLLAYNVLETALSNCPTNLRLRQLKGLSLARSGALERANVVLSELRHEGHNDGETLGLLARTHKDLGINTRDERRRRHHLREAFGIYAAGYRESRQHDNVASAYYTGINAATMAFLCDDTVAARELATLVETDCERALRDPDEGDRYWIHATLAEAALILGNTDEAGRRYARAAELAGTRFGDLHSTRHQARMLLEHNGGSGEWLDSVIAIPPVVVYTGHMVDTPGRLTPRFNPGLEPVIRQQILSALESLRPLAVYGSAACGSDILFLECAGEIGCELHIVLPCPVEQFRETSVSVRREGRWTERFDQALERANEVQVVSEPPPAGGASMYEYANLITTGLGRLRSRLLETEIRGIAVWDGHRAADSGGTGSVVALWREIGIPSEHITIDAEAPAAIPSESLQSRPSDLGALSYSVESMLFADAVGYSRLEERQVPKFIAHFMGSIAALNERTTHRAVHVETAGDGLYMVFSSPEAAGRYALELSEVIGEIDWQRYDLPEDLDIRVGLHCGPVFVGTDPVTGQALYTGTHTSRTSRIEPITPPGQVYASSAFAAVAAAQGVDALHFSYIGRTRLAKDYGILPLYHVQRSTAAE